MIKYNCTNEYSFTNKESFVHIPDGYLSPLTVATTYAIAIPLWIYSFKRLKKSLNEETLPLIGAVTALSFVVMLFNIPIPGGTSGHAIGAALIAILFDPWIGAIAVSLVLLIQSVVFGDGGISALGINSLSMGYSASFIGYFVFKLSKNKKFAPFLAGWTSAVASSFLIALALGLQSLYHSADGKPLYFPFDIYVTIPALVGEHMLIFGVIEGIFTSIVYKFLTQKR